MTKFVSTDTALVDCTRIWLRTRFYSGGGCGPNMPEYAGP